MPVPFPGYPFGTRRGAARRRWLGHRGGEGGGPDRGPGLRGSPGCPQGLNQRPVSVSGMIRRGREEGGGKGSFPIRARQKRTHYLTSWPSALWIPGSCAWMRKREKRSRVGRRLSAARALFPSARCLLLVHLSSSPFRRRVTLYVPARSPACQSHTAVRTRARVVHRADFLRTRGRRPCLDPLLFAPRSHRGTRRSRIHQPWHPKQTRRQRRLPTPATSTSRTRSCVAAAPSFDPGGSCPLNTACTLSWRAPSRIA